MIKLIFSYGLPSFVMNALGAFTVNFANMFLVRYSDTAVCIFRSIFQGSAVDFYDGERTNSRLFAYNAV